MKLRQVHFEHPQAVPGVGTARHLYVYGEGMEIEAEVSEGFLWFKNGVGVPLAGVRYVVRDTPSVDVPRDEPQAGPPSPGGSKAKGRPKK